MQRLTNLGHLLLFSQAVKVAGLEVQQLGPGLALILDTGATGVRLAYYVVPAPIANFPKHSYL